LYKRREASLGLLIVLEKIIVRVSLIKESPESELVEHRVVRVVVLIVVVIVAFSIVGTKSRRVDAIKARLSISQDVMVDRLEVGRVRWMLEWRHVRSCLEAQIWTEVKVFKKGVDFDATSVQASVGVRAQFKDEVLGFVAKLALDRYFQCLFVVDYFGLSAEGGLVSERWLTD